MKIFSCGSQEEKRLFNLIKSVYVEERYSPEFVVTKNDIDSLFPIVSQLFDLVKKYVKRELRSIKNWIKTNFRNEDRKNRNKEF